MIYVWDNGGSYSDHDFVLIEAPDSLPKDEVLRFIRSESHHSDSDAAVLLIAGQAEWLDGARGMPLYDWAFPHCLRSERGWEDASPAVIRYLLDGWTGESQFTATIWREMIPLLVKKAKARGIYP